MRRGKILNIGQNRMSRRIDDANRIVYRIEDNIIKIVQCGSHYRDK